MSVRRVVRSREVSLVSTRTDDGVLLHGTRVVGGDPSLGLVGVHGAWGNFYANAAVPVLDAVAARGRWTTVAMNLRSHDLGSAGDGEPCHGFVRTPFEACVADLDAALDVARDAGAESIVVIAHSFGAHGVCYWLKEQRPDDVVGLVLLSPAPRLQGGARWFVDGSVEHHLARAAVAVASGVEHQLIVLSDRAPVPMVAEARVALSVWGPDSRARAEEYVGDLDLPVLVTVGGREPPAYRERAAVVAAAAGVEVVTLDDDHYYANDPATAVSTVLDWIDDHVAEFAVPEVSR